MFQGVLLNMKTDPTIKDIAEKAGVSFGVAAAVLRNKKCNIRFSQATGEKVHRIANELNYHPNLLAQAIVSGKTPLVVISLHLENFNIRETHYYLHDHLLTASMSLHEAGFEMIFLPYKNHEEQVERLRSLLDGKLASGVISNFIPNEDAVLTEYLKSKNTPCVILGKHPDQSICKVVWNESPAYTVIAKLATESGHHRIIRIGMNRSEKNWSYSEFQLTGDKHKEINERDFNFSDKDIMFFSDNDTIKQLIEKKKVAPSQVIVLEDSRRNVSFKPAVVIHKTTSNAPSAAVEILVKWINSGKEPKNKLKIASLKPSNIEVLK
jgi:DNA-binding LacI/PurR family transcriptional regulator